VLLDGVLAVPASIRSLPGMALFAKEVYVRAGRLPRGTYPAFANCGLLWTSLTELRKSVLSIRP
jgi:hypothetical protein